MVFIPGALKNNQAMHAVLTNPEPWEGFPQFPVMPESRNIFSGWKIKLERKLNHVNLVLVQEAGSAASVRCPLLVCEAELLQTASSVFFSPTWDFHRTLQTHSWCKICLNSTSNLGTWNCVRSSPHWHSLLPCGRVTAVQGMHFHWNILSLYP